MPVAESPLIATEARVPRKLASFAASPRVRWADRAAKWIISGFGLFVILTVVLILLFVGKEAVPLFYAPGSKEKSSLTMPALGKDVRLLSWSVDEFQEYSYGLASDGHLYYISNADGRIRHDIPIQGLLTDHPEMVWVSPSGDQMIAAMAHGKIKILNLEFHLEYGKEGQQVIRPSMKESPTLNVLAGRPNREASVERIAGSYQSVGETLALAIYFRDGLLLAGTWNAASQSLDLKPVETTISGKPTGLVIDNDARYLMLSTDANKIYRWDLSENAKQVLQVIEPSRKGSYVSAMRALIGNVTYILGYNDGSVEAWFGVRREGGSVFVKVREFDRHSLPVADIAPSSVNRSFWTYDMQGGLKMHFNPSARKLYTFDAGGPIRGVAPNSHLNGISVLGANGAIRQWDLHNPHPEITWGTLFSKIWYEGYEHPNYTWQSSSGSDNFEAKFSLTPLVVGTFKGAFFGLIFGIPIAVFAALYTSQLMTSQIRSFVKPTIEIMAALPSVVIGFLAGLWIAPFMEKNLVAFLLAPPLMLTLILTGSSFFFRLPLKQRSRIPQSIELGILFALIALSLFLAHILAGPVEKLCFHGNIQQWIYDTTGQKVEQRNSLVIGLAMGFAVIPIIFSICEDAMSNVPRHYISGSLALGATRWQSAVRVVLPTASPGIFSAVMLGFGRAVGETMIVLMATGNTPILSLSPFNGMRTLSANIAVEIPEAPYEGSLYRVLFLAAALLFLATFVINTAAEVIRLRLREKYRAL